MGSNPDWSLLCHISCVTHYHDALFLEVASLASMHMQTHSLVMISVHVDIKLSCVFYIQVLSLAPWQG